MREWLCAAYGDGEADEAMRLSWELRVQLYPEVLRVGPCGAAVQEFFDAVKAAGGSVTLQLAFSEMFQVMRRNGGFLLEGSVDEFLYTLVCDEAKRVLSSQGSPVVELIAVVALAVSVEWVSVGVRNTLASVTAEIDAVLIAVGLPVLRVALMDG